MVCFMGYGYILKLRLGWLFIFCIFDSFGLKLLLYLGNCHHTTIFHTTTFITVIYRPLHNISLPFLLVLPIRILM